jgi:hypothetical protein
MSEFYEKFFIVAPVPTGRTGKDGHAVYLNFEGKEVLWSAKFPIPAIGQRVYIAMNSIGWAVVKGYFESCGFVGVMTLPSKPPKYLREQNKRDRKDLSKPQWYREGIGCEYGSEILLKPSKYHVFNATDGVYATPRALTWKSANRFINEFRKRFEPQGFYASVHGRIPISEVNLVIKPAEERAA